jgi:hypothetical protein
MEKNPTVRFLAGIGIFNLLTLELFIAPNAQLWDANLMTA